MEGVPRGRPASPALLPVEFPGPMALPKVKLSKSKKGRRRSHLALALVQLQPCPNCKRPHRPHTVCPNCGHYGAGSGREVIKVKE